MEKFARIENGIVIETILAESAEVDGKKVPGITVDVRERPMRPEDGGEWQTPAVEDWTVVGRAVIPLLPPYYDWRIVSEEVEANWEVSGTTFTAPQPTPMGVTRQLTFLEFMTLFEEEEQLAIVATAMQSAPIKLWYDKALGASYINLDDGRTALGVQALVDAGLISEERRDSGMAGQAPV